MGKVFTTSYRGVTFNIMHGYHNASIFTYQDEQSVRDSLFGIQPGDTLFDIGCAYGSYALSALAIGAAYVYAWTPDKDNHDTMALSLTANGWQDRVSLFETGLYSKTGWLDQPTQMFSTESFHNAFRVQALDDVVLTHEPVVGMCWLKSDTEGAEEHILRGSVKFLAKYRPKILLENHDFLIPNATRDVRAFLESQGYEHQRTVPYNAISHSLFHPR